MKRQFGLRLSRFVSECRYQQTLQALPDQKEVSVSLDELKKKNLNVNQFQNFFILMSRCYSLYFRNPQSFWTKIVQTIGLAIFTIFLFANKVDIGINTQQAILDKAGLAFTIAQISCLSGVFSNLYVFIPAIPTFKKEHHKKIYGPASFYFTHAFFPQPMVILFSNLYLLLIFWTTPMRNESFELYMQWLVVVLCCRFAGSGLCDLLCLVLKKIEVVNQAYSLVVIPFILVSGFVANIKTVAVYMKVYSYLSCFRFGFQAAAEIEFAAEVTHIYKSRCRL